MNNQILNKLKKNFQSRKSWIIQNSIKAYRLYDRDIPAFPYIIDIYNSTCLVYERGKKDIENEVRKESQELINAALSNLYPHYEILFKIRKRQEGHQQYEKSSFIHNDFEIIEESSIKYYVNFKKYLDVGLFLDHRYLRNLFLKSELKGKSFLNLFCYTSSVSLSAAFSGARTTNVDLSNTYIKWSKENFALNLFNSKHDFFSQDSFSFLDEGSSLYDIIYVDPPTFSNSKKLGHDFDVVKDHISLIDMCFNRLAENGVIYFSNNKRGFKLDEGICEKYNVTDISQKSIPHDFRDKKIHQCYILKRRSI